MHIFETFYERISVVSFAWTNYFCPSTILSGPNHGAGCKIHLDQRLCYRIVPCLRIRGHGFVHHNQNLLVIIALVMSTSSDELSSITAQNVPYIRILLELESLRMRTTFNTNKIFMKQTVKVPQRQFYLKTSG